MKKIITALCLSIALAMFGTIEDSQARPVCNDTDFYEYGSNVDLHNEEVTYTHLKTNPTAFPETHSINLTRSMYADASFTASYEVNAVVQKVGVSMEVSIGTSTSFSENISWTIPPNSTRFVEYGYLYVETYGTIRHYSMFCALLGSTT